MCEIKFRGQTEYNKTWVIGNLVIDKDTYYIYSKENVYPNMKLEKVNGFYIYIVIKETIGQYTGLHDENGKEIYEGDIIEDEWARYKVIYYLDGFSLEVIKLIKDCGTQLELKYALADFNNECVVIGNIYENKSLLGA